MTYRSCADVLVALCGPRDSSHPTLRTRETRNKETEKKVFFFSTGRCSRSSETEPRTETGTDTRAARLSICLSNYRTKDEKRKRGRKPAPRALERTFGETNREMSWAGKSWTKNRSFYSVYRYGIYSTGSWLGRYMHTYIEIL